jgi:hypothetical protein
MNEEWKDIIMKMIKKNYPPMSAMSVHLIKKLFVMRSDSKKCVVTFPVFDVKYGL